MLSSEDSQTDAALFVLLRAVDAFVAVHSRYPGTCLIVHSSSFLIVSRLKQ